MRGQSLWTVLCHRCPGGQAWFCSDIPALGCVPGLVGLPHASHCRYIPGSVLLRGLRPLTVTASLQMHLLLRKQGCILLVVLDPLKWLSFCEILDSSSAVGREWMKLAVGLLPRPPPPPHQVLQGGSTLMDSTLSLGPCLLLLLIETCLRS